MGSVRWSRLFLSGGLSIGLLAGCGGSQAGAPPTMQQNAAGANSRTNPRTSSTEFTVKGRDLQLNGTSFFIKGVDYGNTQIDAYSDPNPLDNANEKVWQPDLTAMRAAGINS